MVWSGERIQATIPTADELAEPFDVIVPVGRSYDEPTYYRKRPPLLAGVVFHEGVSADDLTLTDLLVLAPGAQVLVSPSWWAVLDLNQ